MLTYADGCSDNDSTDADGGGGGGGESALTVIRTLDQEAKAAIGHTLRIRHTLGICYA